jgi:hypothetical protein
LRQFGLLAAMSRPPKKLKRTMGEDDVGLDVEGLERTASDEFVVVIRRLPPGPTYEVTVDGDRREVSEVTVP